MHSRSRYLLWIFSLCLLVSCAHREDASRQVSQQPVPPAVPAASAAQVAVPSVGSAPTIQLEETSHNFGTVSEDLRYAHSFKIRNTGSGMLEIKKVLPG